MTATPIYQTVSFCRDEQTLWRKVESQWDFLGVKPDGQFVVGYPRRGEGFTMRAAGTVVKAGARQGQHGVRIYVPRGPGPSCDWYATPEQAQAAYRQAVEREQSLDAPGIVRVERVEDGKPVEEERIVPRVPTYG